MKKLLFALCASLMLSTPVSATTLQDTSSGSIPVEGTIGTGLASAYAIKAQNFTVPVSQVSSLNILKASKASIVDASGGSVSGLELYVIETTVKPQIGVYTALLGIKGYPGITKLVTIFVTDQNSVTDGRTVIYGHDFSMWLSEKAGLTASKAKTLAQVRAFDIASGNEITDQVSVDGRQLAAYIKTTTLGGMPLRFSVPSSGSGRFVSLEIQAFTLKDNGGPPPTPPTPSTPPVEPPTPGNPTSNAPLVSPTTQVNKGEQAEGKAKDLLPSTGEAEPFSLIVLGLVLLSGLGLVVSLRIKKKLDES